MDHRLFHLVSTSTVQHVHMNPVWGKPKSIRHRWLERGQCVWPEHSATNINADMNRVCCTRYLMTMNVMSTARTVDSTSQHAVFSWWNLLLRVLCTVCSSLVWERFCSTPYTIQILTAPSQRAVRQIHILWKTNVLAILQTRVERASTFLVLTVTTDLMPKFDARHNI